jgi:uncharacterized DUF497 family protein
MDAPTFEWDPVKAAANVAKHGVSFEEAATAFQDPLARIHADPHHSASESREILIGHSAQGRLILVAFTDRQQGRLRLISAREVTRRERRDYEESQQGRA